MSDQYTVEHSAPDDADVVRSISRLAAHDTTNVQAGLDLGVELADAARRERPDAFNYIILMSDGVANVDATDPFAILESASDSDSSNPLRLITVGVGIENYNDVLLEQLAQHGNGWYRYLDDATQARETFSRERWLALSTPFADQTRAQVTWDPTVVRSWRIVGYENRVTPDHTFEQNRKEFAELPAGAATTVFYELELWSNAGLPQVLGSVEVRWVEPASGESRSQTAKVSHRTDVSFGRATTCYASAPSSASRPTATAASRRRSRARPSTRPACTPTSRHCSANSTPSRAASDRPRRTATSTSSSTRSRTPPRRSHRPRGTAPSLSYHRVKATGAGLLK